MSHDHKLSSAAAQRGRLVAVFAITLAVLVVELVGAALSGSLALLADAPIRVDPEVLAQASESEKGAQYLAEATAYPDDTAAIVADFQAEMERVRGEFLRRR